MENDAKWKQITLAKKSPDYWALHPTTGLCTRLLGFAPESWALHPTAGLLPDYWDLHPTTGLFIQLLGFEPEYWVSIRILGFYPNTWLLPEYRGLTQIPKSNFLLPLRSSPKSKRTRSCAGSCCDTHGCKCCHDILCN